MTINLTSLGAHDDTPLKPDPRAIADYFRMLYGADGGDAPGWLTVFTLPNSQTVWVPADELFGETPDRIAKLAATQSVYHGMALQDKRAESGRGDAEHAYVLPGVWHDLDIGGATHKATNLPTCIEEALDFVESLPLEPSLVVHSGGGLYVHWLYTDLQLLASPADRTIGEDLSKRVQAGINARGKERGWTFDATGDLARILRPAGTLNWKTGAPLPVRIIFNSDVRYQPKELVALCMRRPPVVLSRPRTAFFTGAANPALAGRRYAAKIGPQGEGNRDTVARQIAVMVCNDLALSSNQALEILREWNSTNNPPLHDSVIVEKVRRGLKGARRPYGCALEAA